MNIEILKVKVHQYSVECGKFKFLNCTIQRTLVGMKNKQIISIDILKVHP